MAFIAWKERKPFVADITLIKLLIIFHVDTLNMLLPLVICLEKLVTERTGECGRFMELRVIGKFVLGLELLTTSCTDEVWQLLICVNDEMLLEFSWVLEAFATFRAEMKIFLLRFFDLSVVFIRFTSTIDMSLFGIVPLPWYDSLVLEEHVVPEGKMVVE